MGAKGKKRNFQSQQHALWWQLIRGLLTQRERKNSLPWLTPQRAQELFSAWRRGEMAEPQLAWDLLEVYDATLFTVKRARLGALAAMPWSIATDTAATGNHPALAELATAQQQELEAALSRVENLQEACTHLGMADFRGVAALEITATGDGTERWEVIEPWNLVRPVRRGPWYYNEEADPTPARPEYFLADKVIIRESAPISLAAMFLICAKNHSVQAWDSFLDTFGTPSIFIEQPPGTTQEEALQFAAVAERLIGEGRGTIPSGTKFQTVETQQNNAEAFEARARYCDETLITLACGGLLTVAAAPDSGTLAGNAHADSFARLCAASARSISEAINRQYCRRILQKRFPGQPALATFTLAPEPADERLQQAQLIATLATAGFAPSAEEVSRMMGFPVSKAGFAGFSDGHVGASAAKLPQAPYEEGARLGAALANSSQSPVDRKRGAGGSAASPGGRVDVAAACSATGADRKRGEAPLTAEELAALQQLASAVPSAENLEADAADAYAALADAVRHPGASAEEAEPAVENRTYQRDDRGRFASTGAAQHSHKGGRSSKGNPAAPTTHSNTPLKAAKGAKPQAKVDAVAHALKATAKKGKVESVATLGKSQLDISSGHPDYYGTRHAARHFKPKDTDAQKTAKTLVHGSRQKDDDGTAITYKSTRVITKKGGIGKTKMITAYNDSHKK